MRFHKGGLVSLPNEKHWIQNTSHFNSLEGPDDLACAGVLFSLGSSLLLGFAHALLPASLVKRHMLITAQI